MTEPLPEAWFMLDLPAMRLFIMDYASYAVRNSRGAQMGSGRMSPDEWFHIWKQKMKDQEPICQSCRIG